MILARAAALLGRWIGPIAAGTALGLVAVAASRLGAWVSLVDGAVAVARGLDARVGPVWIPMALVSLRVGWIAVRALRTRSGRGVVGAPVRPELSQLAPLFAALGLCGTVWGLIRAFDALESGQFLTQLPLLLAGLGAAMGSTLVGLSLQIGTLLLGVINPAWSWALVKWRDGEACFSLDGQLIGRGASGLAALVETIVGRQRDELGLAFDARVPADVRKAARETLWRSLDAAIPLREVRG